MRGRRAFPDAGELRVERTVADYALEKGSKQREERGRVA